MQPKLLAVYKKSSLTYKNRRAGKENDINTNNSIKTYKGEGKSRGIITTELPFKERNRSKQVNTFKSTRTKRKAPVEFLAERLRNPH